MPPVDSARWTTTLTASYLAITAALIAIFGKAVPGRAWLIAVHLTLFAALLILNRASPSAGILRVIRDWHPLMLFPLLFKEVELLAAVIGDWRLTTAIPAWESALFAGQPSLYLSERLAFVPLSEYLHFCYLSYVIVIPAVSAYWYVSGRRTAFGELLLILSTVLLGSYLFFILLPVDSPYHRWPRLGPPFSGHFFFDLVQQVSARGGARGGAFPSAHVSGAVVVSLVAWRHQRRLAYLLVPFTVSVMIATVFGRFHYVLDTLAGAALAIVVVMAYRYLAGDNPSVGASTKTRAIFVLCAIALGGISAACGRQSMPSPELLEVPSGALTLRAQLWRPAGPGPFATVLFSHGSSSSDEPVPPSEPEALGRLFARHGYAFLWLYRQGTGLSKGQGIADGDQMDRAMKADGIDGRNRVQLQLLEHDQFDEATAALAQLREQPGVDRARIALVGHSFGGALSLLIAAREPGIHAVVSFGGAAGSWNQSPPLRERLIAAVGRVSVPVLFIHAANDYSTGPGTVLSAEMQRLGKPHALKIYPPFGADSRAGHNLIFESISTWESDVFAFLDAWTVHR